MSRRCHIACVVAALGLLLTVHSGAADPMDPCAAVAQRIERHNGMPSGVLRAIALTESGRWLAGEQRSVAWPWTVTSGSEHYYLPDKVSAEATVRRLRRAGRTNIDVGCMQINLHYHPDAFANLSTAFTPEANVAYAAAYLIELRQREHSWANAVAHYHSADLDTGQRYRRRVYHHWNRVRRQPAAAFRMRRGGARSTHEDARSAERRHLHAWPPAGAADSSGPIIIRGE